MPLRFLEKLRRSYLEGFGGLGFTTPVVSYAPRPIFMSVSKLLGIMDSVGKSRKEPASSLLRGMGVRESMVD